MSKILNPPEQLISDLTYPRPRWRYFILFQSWSQFESWMATLAVFSLFSGVIFRLIDHNGISIVGILIGAGVGSLFSVLLVIPVQFTISSGNQYFFDFLIRQLEYFGYVKESNDASGIVFRQKLPRFLRWNEGSVTIRSEFGIIRVAGAMYILRLIRRNLIVHNQQSHS